MHLERATDVRSRINEVYAITRPAPGIGASNTASLSSHLLVLHLDAYIVYALHARVSQAYLPNKFDTFSQDNLE